MSWQEIKSATSATISPKTPSATATGRIARWAVASDVAAEGPRTRGSPGGKTRAISDSTSPTFLLPPDTCTREIVGSEQQCKIGRVKAGVAKMVGLRSVSSTIKLLQIG